MAKFKDFGAGAPAGAREPISFKLHGEEFQCNPELQGAVLLELVAKSNSDDAAEAAVVIAEFFEYVLLPDSYTAFNKVTKSADRMVTLDTLGDITGWLVEAYSDRPNTGPEVSSPGA